MSLNGMRNTFGHSAKWILGLITAAVVITTFAGLGIGTNLTAGQGGGAAAPASRSEDVVATVNGDPITRAELDQQTQSGQEQARMMGQNLGVAQGAELKSEALKQLTLSHLIFAKAQQMGFTASGAEIEKERNDFVTRLGLREKLGLKPTASLTDVDDALTKNGAQALKDQDQFSDDTMRRSIILKKLQDSLAPATVTDQEARDFYKEWHTRHILIDNKKRSDEQAQAQARQLLAKATAPGADFAALAKQYSDDPGTKSKGGDDGWIGEDNSFNNYVPEFTKAAALLQPGQVTSDLVKVPQFGYFIIKADAVRENLPKDFDKNKAQHIAEIKQQKQGQKEHDFITALQADPSNKIVIKDPALRAQDTLAKADGIADPAQRNAQYNAALKDLQTALKGGNSALSTGEIQTQIARIYQSQHQIPQAIAAYQAALTATDDPDLHMQLGNLYQQNKDTASAIAQYQLASTDASDNQSLHIQLMENYIQMKRMDLATQEQTWIKNYQKSQQAATPPTLPGGVTIPSGATTTPAGTITVKPASGAPTTVKKPTQ